MLNLKEHQEELWECINNNCRKNFTQFKVFEKTDDGGGVIDAILNNRKLLIQIHFYGNSFRICFRYKLSKRCDSIMPLVNEFNNKSSCYYVATVETSIFGGIYNLVISNSDKRLPSIEETIRSLDEVLTALPTNKELTNIVEKILTTAEDELLYI